jgi:hypothetical protein
MNLESRIGKLELKIGGGKNPTRREVLEAVWRDVLFGEPFPYNSADLPSELMDSQIAEWMQRLIGGGEQR